MSIKDMLTLRANRYLLKKIFPGITNGEIESLSRDEMADLIYDIKENYDDLMAETQPKRR